MSLQAFVWAVRTLTLLALGALGFLISFLDPDAVGMYGTLLFFVLGSLSFFGLSYLGILGMYRLFLGDEKAVHYLGSIVRQSALLLVGVVALLLLFQNMLWYWWSALLVTAFVLLLEFTLRGSRKEVLPENSPLHR